MNLPGPIKNLSDELTELPSLGPRQAIRLVFYLLGRGKDFVHNLANDVDSLKNLKTCERCFFVHQNNDNLCDICRTASRRQDIVMIVEKETDLLSVENTKKYNGRYLILGTISKTGALEDWQKLRLQSLKSFVQKSLGGQAEEIILGLNPSSLGDFHASLLRKELEPFAKKISRLGRGLPTGGEIEFADDETLGESLQKRS